jgi:hypothetical protein
MPEIENKYPALSPPAVSFNAAAVANMHFYPLNAQQDGISGFSWKIGKLFWLPREKREKRN